MAQFALKKMFGSLFGKDKASAGPEAAIPDIDPFQETVMRLQQLVEERAFVEVRFPMKSHNTFQSLIIKVDPIERFLLIDELFPATRSLLATSGDLVEITSQARGMPVKFRTTIQSVGIEDADGMPAYRLALPGRVSAEQRRRNFRLPLVRDSGVKLRIRNGDGSALLCTVLNISHGGIGFSCQGNISERLRNNVSLVNSVVILPDGHDLSVDLEARSFEYRRQPYRHTIVGSRITRIGGGDEKLIDQFLVGIQRQLRRDAMEDEPID